ncbi:hypothetical protein BH23GEM10_BH23GEM10_09240 [soil metagenome]
MIVTAILSLLALLAVGPLMKARERTMIAAARMEVSNMVKAAEMYRALNGRLPAEVALLDGAGHVQSPHLIVCRYELTSGQLRDLDQLRVDVRHAGTRRGVTTTHPASNGVTTELDLNECGEGSSSEPAAPAEDDESGGGVEQPGVEQPPGPGGGRGPPANPGRGGGRGNRGGRGG